MKGVAGRFFKVALAGVSLRFDKRLVRDHTFALHTRPPGLLRCHDERRDRTSLEC